MKLKGEITPGKIFAVLVLVAGTFMALELESWILGLITIVGVLALYGVRKAIIAQIIKSLGGTR